MTTAHQERSRPEAPLELQLKGYRLATAEILYRMPDHPSLLQTFIWQHYDLAPDYPQLRKFLAFWAENDRGQAVQRPRRPDRDPLPRHLRPRRRRLAAPLSGRVTPARSSPAPGAARA